jgi:hypothetical protein
VTRELLVRLVSCLSLMHLPIVLAVHTERLVSVVLSTRGKLTLLQQLALGKGSRS